MTRVFEEMIHYADKIGALSGSAVLALGCMYLAWKNNKIEKQSQDSQKFWGELRTQEAVSDSKVAEALEKLGDSYSRLTTIIDERLRRRD